MKDILQKLSRGQELGQSEIDDLIFGIKELNAGATLVVAGKASSLHEGIGQAQETLDSGKAMAKLMEIRDRSRELKGVSVR